MSGRRGHGEGAIYQRADGRWVGAVDLGWDDGKRRRRVLYGRTRAEVRERIRDLQAQIDGGVVPAPDRLTVAIYLEQWLDRLSGTIGERSEDTYRRAVRLYLVPTIGSIRLAKLSPADVTKMLQTLQARGLAPETRRLARAVLRRALRRAQQDGILVRNVAALADGPRIPKRDGRTLTPEQAKQFLAAVRGERLEAAYVVTLALGLRRGEVLGLSWEDLDLESDEPTLRVRRQLIRGRDGLELTSVKTLGSNRTLHVPEPVVAVLRAHWAAQATERVKAGPRWANEAHLVFTGPLGAPLDVDAFGKSVPRLMKKAGLGHWHIHELRHSCASLLLAMGVPLEVVSETLGHSSIRVTKDVYGHLLAPARAKAARAMQQALWSEDEEPAEPLATKLATQEPAGEAENALTRSNVRPLGLEPRTCGLRVRCSAKLS